MEEQIKKKEKNQKQNKKNTKKTREKKPKKTTTNVTGSSRRRRQSVREWDSNIYVPYVEKNCGKTRRFLSAVLFHFNFFFQIFFTALGGCLTHGRPLDKLKLSSI